MQLKLLRERLNLQQKDLADELKVTKAALSHYETGRREPDINTLIRFADYFNVSVDYLLGRDYAPTEIEQKNKAHPNLGELSENEILMINILRFVDDDYRNNITAYAEVMANGYARNNGVRPDYQKIL